MKFVVYVLSSLTTKKSYVGQTVNLDRRIEEHNKGRNLYTKRYMPWQIVLTEEFNSRIEARKREKYLKSTSGRKKVLKKLFNK